MTRLDLSPDFDPRIADWLEADPDDAPPAVLETVVAAFPSIPQRRAARAPWRFRPMTLTARLVAAAIAIAVVAAGGALLLRPTTPNVLSLPSPSASSTPSQPIGPSARPLAPSGVIDLAGLTSDAIPIAADGDDLWVGIDGGLIHIDGRTLAKRQLDVPAMRTGNGALLVAADGLWIADYRGQRIQRVDPTTGAVELSASALGPLDLYLVGDDLWVGTGLDGGLHRVDRTTGSLGPKVGTTHFATVGLGQFWSGSPPSPTSTSIGRLDPATGKVVSSVTVPKGMACGISGSFPDNIWAGCPHLPDAAQPAQTQVQRIDPATNGLTTVVTIPGTYNGVAAVVDGVPWFLAGRFDAGKATYTLVAADPASGQLLAALDPGEMDPDGALATPAALWIPDEAGRRILRFDLSALHP